MPKMLRHTTTGEIWPFNVDLARHEDVEVVDHPDEQFRQAVDSGKTIGDLQEDADPEQEASKPKAKAKAKRKPKAKAAAPNPDPELGDDDPLAGLELDEEDD